MPDPRPDGPRTAPHELKSVVHNIELSRPAVSPQQKSTIDRACVSPRRPPRGRLQRLVMLTPTPAGPFSYWLIVKGEFS